MSPAGGGAAAKRICVATAGFFVLDRCGRPARAGCTRCTRSICNRHSCSVPGGAAGLCPECYAAERGVMEPEDDFWAIGYRRNFYWETAQHEGDATWWSTFDDFDRQAFDPEVAGEGEYAEYTESGDLVDS